jgi:S1-C subfamily serine protease
MNEMPIDESPHPDWSPHPPSSQPMRMRRPRRIRPAVAAALVLGAAAASAAVGHAVWPSKAAPGASVASAASVASRIDDTLVDVNSTFGYQGASGAGTGIVLTSNGEVLTNNHVIDGATSISVTDVGNGQTYSATVVGYDKSDDVAVLQLQGASGLATARIGSSAGAAVGQQVTAVGNAGGVGGTPTSASGTITALRQAITASDELDGTTEQLSNLIETDADVQPGDSGGALVNSAGEVIGMNTAASQGYSLQSTASQGYAIPIDQALRIARQIESGKASPTVHVGSTGFLGVLASGSGSVLGSGSTGAVVGEVVPGAAAAQAGIVAGDLITSVDGHAVGSATALSRLLAAEHAGSRVRIGWTDSSGQAHTSTVELGSGPPG